MTERHPLIGHASPRDVLAWRHGAPVSAGQFLRDVRRLAAAMPAAGHVLNVCADRYRFAVGLMAALVAGKVSLLPPSHTPETVRRMKEFAADTFCLADAPSNLALPLFHFDDALLEGDAPVSAESWPTGEQAVPRIAAEQTLAFVFTSGSTGVPVPHRKTWGGVVRNVRAEARALGLQPGAAPAVLATVPPQHMYGIESSVLMPLQSGAALCAAHPFFPADICADLAALPRPRILVTTPVHLRTLIDAGVEVPRVDLVLSATAPLSGELARSAERSFADRLQEIYGSTETGQIASRRSAHAEDWNLLPGIALEQRDGRTWASGGHVEQETPLGDVIELRAGGGFRLHGRIGDLVNIAGKRNSLGYLNHQLLAIPGVRDGVFYMPGGEPPDGVLRLMAFVVAPGMTVAALRQALRERIDPVFMPRPLVLLSELPRNSTGKLARESLEALAGDHARGMQGATDAA